MRTLTLWTSVATIVALNAILWLGLLDAGDARCFDGPLLALHVVLPLSTVLIVVLLLNDRLWAGVALFGAIIAGMLVDVTLALAGLAFSRSLHLALDLGALNVYLLVVPRYFSGSAGPIARRRRER